MLQKIAHQSGWPLADAIARTADVDLWRAKKRIDEELRRAGGAVTPAQFAEALRRGEPEKRLRARTQIADEAIDAHDRLLHELDSKVRAQRMFAARDDLVPLTPAEWSSCFRSNNELSTLRFFPLLWLPDAAERLAGLHLVEAFARAVTCDPEVVAATQRDSLGPVLDAMFTHRRKEWPACLESWDIVAEWLAERCDPAVYRDPADPTKHRVSPHAVGQNLLEGVGIITDRAMRFIQLFRDRALVAKDGEQPIPPERWFSPFLWIDFVGGHLLEERHGDLIKCSEPLKLVKPETIGIARAAIVTENQKNRWAEEPTRGALKRKGLDKRLGDRTITHKQMAAEIANDPEINARTELEVNAVAKRIGRIRKPYLAKVKTQTSQTSRTCP
jgi:hypothetical protein